MSRRDDLKLLCENAVGFSDVSLAPDVVLGLLAELDVSSNVGRALTETLESVCESRDALARVVEKLKTEAVALRKALESCAEELSAEVICKHGGQKIDDMHPVTRRLYERDMAPVIEARAALGQGERP